MRREVAIKTLHVPSPEARARFLEEAQVTGQLDHPNIVQIHEIGVAEGGVPFLVMRRVKGRRLSDILLDEAAGKGSRHGGPRRLLGIFLKVCDAVAFAHAKGVIHRDIKPGNIMVGEFGDALLLDWGLAKVLGKADGDGSGVSTSRGEPGGPMDTITGVVKGTAAYMAPEQAVGRPEEIDARADIYSLGAVLYEILTRQPIVTGSSESVLLAKAAGRAAPDRPTTAFIPRELDAVVRKAMRVAKEER